MSSLRYQVFNAIRSGCKTAREIREKTGNVYTTKRVISAVSKLRCQGLIQGAAGDYRAVAEWFEDDGRGRSSGSAIGRERGTVLMRGDSPVYKPSPCLLADLWK